MSRRSRRAVPSATADGCADLPSRLELCREGIAPRSESPIAVAVNLRRRGAVDVSDALVNRASSAPADGTRADTKTLLRCKRVRHSDDGAPHPEKDDPRTKVAIVSAFRWWNRLFGNKAPLNSEKGAAHVKAMNWTKGAFDEPRWAIREVVRRISTRRNDEAVRCAQGNTSLRVL
jgi:hypothetical protein